MFAIVEAGGRQEKVAPGVVVVVDRLDVEPGDMRHLEVALERIRASADIERSESIVVLSNIIERRP